KLAKEALALAKGKPLVVDYDDPEFTGAGERLGGVDYEDFLAAGDADFAWKMPDDEWDAISLNYTSGTTGDPKGVVYHHRGAYLPARGALSPGAAGKSTVSSWGAAVFPTQLCGSSGGRFGWLRARICACPRCARGRCTPLPPATRSRIFAARRS